MFKGTMPSLQGSDDTMSMKTFTLQATALVPWTGAPSNQGAPSQRDSKCLARRQRRRKPGGCWLLPETHGLDSTRHGVPCPASRPKPHRRPRFPTQFIISGSLSVAAEKNHTSCLVSLNRGPGARVGPLPGSTLLCFQRRSPIWLLQ